MSSRQDYRADVDGLRAIAVFGVVLFHAGLTWLPGGFVGVDVFFVISGYLITGIIVRNSEPTWDFLRAFYEKRIRRIVPPALPVLAFTAIFAWHYLPPAALVELAKSTAAYSFFVSNWFFLSIAGYFDGPSHFKPLLHTWSLSIEEQFYLVSPFLILWLRHRGMQAVQAALLLVFFLSLGISIYLIQTGKADAAFYNSFARFWEIALGGLLAVGLISEPPRPRVRQALGNAGLLMIVLSMAIYDSETTFPGLAALLPTLGAAMLILGRDSYANRLLELRPVVAVGLISYGLYLWHWPVFVFIQFAFIGADQIHFLFGIAASTVLATVSYFMLETPVRKAWVLPNSAAIYTSFAAISAVVVATSAWGLSSQGAPYRFPLTMEYTANLDSSRREAAEARLRSTCWIPSEEALPPALARCLQRDPDKQNILLIGDSHAAQFYPALVASLRDAKVSLIATDSCTLIRGAYQTCNDLTEWVEKLARSKDIPFDQVVISARVDAVRSAKRLAELASDLAYSVPVTVFGPIQYYQPSLPTLFPTLANQLGQSQMAEVFTEAVQPDQFAIDAHMEQALHSTPVQYISLLSVTCPEGQAGCVHFGESGLPVTIDDTHLTPEAAAMVINHIAPSLRSFDKGMAKNEHAHESAVGAFVIQVGDE